MKPYPIMLDLAGRLVVVIGGGAVGRRKVEGLLAAEASVRVVDPSAADWPDTVEYVAEPYDLRHLQGASLAFACTGDAALNARIAADAKAAGIIVNVADDPAACDFTVPAVHRTDEVTLAVATDSGVPALAAALRDTCAEALPDQLDAFAQAAAAIRERVKQQWGEAERRELLSRLCGQEGLNAYRQGGEPALAKIIDQASGQ